MPRTPKLTRARPATSSKLVASQRPSKALSAPTAERARTWVPLVRDQGHTVLSNQTRMKALDLSHEKVDSLFGTTNAPDGVEPTSRGIATRYRTNRDESQFGAVRGDGRTVETAQIFTYEGSRITGVSSVTQKGGVDTGLFPAKLVPGVNHHTGGTQPLTFAVKDALSSDYLQRNGVRAERWLAVQRLSPWLARYVREGQFARLAHLKFLENDRPALRDVFDQVNTQLSVELGRATKLTYPGLYKTLVQRKAQDLAALFWARMSHNSVTYDNIGLLGTIDLTILSGQDRFHSTPETSAGPGYANEPAYVHKLFESELRTFMSKAATSAREQDVMAAFSLAPSLKAQARAENSGEAVSRAERLRDGMLRYSMTEHMLSHLGLDADTAAHAMKSQRKASMAAYDTLFAVGRETDTGSYARGAQEYATPARYDVFSALSSLVEISSSKRSRDEKRAALVDALKPLNPDPVRDAAAAERLLTAFEPVIATATTGLNGAARAAKLELVADQAQRINAPLDGLENANAMQHAQAISDHIEKGELAAAGTALQRVTRRNVRTGPTSAHDVAMALRHGRLQPDAEGWLSLSSDSENGVRIEEQSNGARDRIRVTLEGNPAGLADSNSYRLNLGLAEHEWKLGLAPTARQGDTLVFEVPLEPGQRVDMLKLGFVNDRGDRFVDAAGGGLFGEGIRPVLSSKLLQAELAYVASTRGESRDGAASLLKAVRGAPRHGPTVRSVPAVLEQVTSPDDLYNLNLPVARSERPIKGTLTLNKRKKPR